MKKLAFSFLLSLMVLSSVALAQDFTVDYNIKDYYIATQTDYITLKINNPMQEDWFSISLIGSEEWVKTETSLLRVPMFGSETTNLIVSVPKDAIPQINPYQYFLKITRLSTGSVLEQPILLRIKQITNAIITDFALSCKECTDEITVSGVVHNVGSKPIDLSLVIRAGEQTKTVHIGYVNIYGDEEFETSFSLDGVPPGEYTVSALLIDDRGTRMYEEGSSFRIPSIENVLYDKDVSTTIFGSFVTITAENKGNTVADIDLSSINPSAWYEIYSGPSPTGMSITNNYYWRFTLNPEQTRSITYSVVYWPTYTIIIFIIIALALIYTQMSPFTFEKTVMSDRKTDSGEEISVSLSLRNKRGDIDKALIKDVVPVGYTIVSKFETVKPIIRKIVNGVELNWKVTKMKPTEERVFHYTIRSSDGPKPRLPPAKVKAVQNKKMVIKESNSVSLPGSRASSSIVTVKVSK